MYVPGEDVAAIDSSLCKCWSGVGGARTREAAPQLTAVRSLALGEADGGGEGNLLLGSPFHLSRKSSRLRPCGGCSVKAKGACFQLELGGAILVHPLSPHVCSCVRVCVWRRVAFLA